MNNMFSNCQSLISIPQLDTQNVTDMSSMFNSCYSLVSIPQLDTQNVTDMNYMFYKCCSLVSIPQLDTSSVTNMSSMFYNCYSIQTANLKGLKIALQINSTQLLKKDSLLYIINNESATSAITIKLCTYCYSKYSADPDVVDALSNHPNISLAK
jgi:surface protein